MTATGIIPKHNSCTLCGNTGWVTRIDIDGYGYEMPCPNDCPATDLLDDADAEVPY